MSGTAIVIGASISGLLAAKVLSEHYDDVVLVERDELTSGTTWHSAAQVTNFGMNQTMVGLKTHSINLYKELRDDPDYPVQYNHGDGGIRLTNSAAQMDGYRHFASMARGMGVEFEILDAAECARRHPLISTDNLLGGLWDGNDGDIDPASLCQALARRARKAGAEVYRNTPVTGLTQHKDDTWTVHTEKGDIDCEVVINACGYRVNEVGAMMGVQHPVASMEHQYFVTEDIKGIVDAGHRMPALQEVGIKNVVNGPITYTIDGAPLVGPIPGKRNAFCIIGLRAGLGEGGGHGWLLAQQIVHGEACYDTWCIDPRRFGSHTNVELTALKAIEDYQNEFRFHFPNEHRPVGRNAKTTPLTPILAAEGAHFNVVNGWERMEYIKPTADFHVTHGFGFDESFGCVAADVSAVQTNVALAEVNGFNRFEISGVDAQNFLDRMICGRLQRRAGRIGLAYLLNDHGMIKAEATIANIPASDRGPDRIWYGSAAAAELHDMDWLQAHIGNGDVKIKSLTNDQTILVLAGPKARGIMSKVSREDWSKSAFPWLSVCECFIGFAPATVMSVSFSGELAYEIHVPNASIYAAYLALREAGVDHLFGASAIESMRMEKGYLHWKADLLTEFDPLETGIGRFVHMGKSDFVGKAALAKRIAIGPRKKRVSLVLDSANAPARGGASVMQDGRVVGTVTSGDWGHRVGLNLAYAFVDVDLDGPLQIDVLGTLVPARIIPDGPYDSDNTNVRS